MVKFLRYVKFVTTLFCAWEYALSDDLKPQYSRDIYNHFKLPNYAKREA